jgi:hypothetical protein
MKLTYTSVFSYLRVAVAGTLVLAAVALAVTTAKMSTPLRQTEKPAYTPKKADADFFKPGSNAEAKVVAETKNPNSHRKSKPTCGELIRRMKCPVIQL